MQSTSEHLSVFIIQDENIYTVYGKKRANFLFILLVSCFSAPDVITDVARQNRNNMMSTSNAYHREREKHISANQNNLDARMLLIF